MASAAEKYHVPGSGNTQGMATCPVGTRVLLLPSTQLYHTGMCGVPLSGRGWEGNRDCMCLINHIWFCSSVLIGKQPQGLEADRISAPLKGQYRQGNGHGETPALGSPCLLLPWGPLNGMGLSKRRAIITVVVTRLQTQALN